MKKFILFCICIIQSFWIYADKVDMNQIFLVTKVFFDSQSNKKTETSIIKCDSLSFSGKTQLYYISTNKGYAIVSSDNRVKPILAYSTSSIDFQTDDMPDALRELIIHYESTIAGVKQSDEATHIHPDWDVSFKNRDETNATTEQVVLERSTEVLWNQAFNNEINCINSYNSFCPTWYNIGCGHTLVGCGAVAMAQIMWYWQWPHCALVPNSIDMSGNPSTGLHLREINWNLMPTELLSNTPNDQAVEIASFLRDCGYAIRTEYQQNGSFSYIKNIADALKTLFGFSNDIDIYREESTPMWNYKIRTEINHGRPIIYYGSNYEKTIGHYFIINGYNSQGYYHINWGAGGAYNNVWYTLNNLIIHNYTGYEDYSFNQYAIMGIEPQPICGSINQVSGMSLNNFYESAKIIRLSNFTIPANDTTIYFARDYIKLSPGFHACAGSNVHFGIRDIPCEEDATSSRLSASQRRRVEDIPNIVETAKFMLNVSPNPATNSITISGLHEDAVYCIYNLTGEKVRETAETTIDISALPAGMYVVIATADGETYQSKFIKE